MFVPSGLHVVLAVAIDDAIDEFCMVSAVALGGFRAAMMLINVDG